MGGESVVDSVRQDSKSVIENEHKEKDDASESTKLNTGANLRQIRGRESGQGLTRLTILRVIIYGFHIVCFVASAPF